MIPSSQDRHRDLGSAKTTKTRSVVSHVLAANQPPSAGKKKTTIRSRQPAATSARDCSLCQHNHALHHCPKFLAYSPSKRLTTVTPLRRCFNCLSGHHRTDDCLNPRRCRLCGQAHRTLLHDAGEVGSSRDSHLSSTQGSPSNADHLVTAHTLAPSTAAVLLATARVRLSTPQGRWATVRALLDQESAATLLSGRVVQFLRVTRRSSPVCIAGIDGTRTIARETTIIHISPDGLSTPVCTTMALILASLTQYRPDCVSCPQDWTHTSGLLLADPNPFSSDPIDLIIGADLYGQILRD